MIRNTINWKKYFLEFLSIFIAVISAFALNNWQENRRAAQSENKILVEIANGLEKDLEDIKTNILGHQLGLDACNYFRNALVSSDNNPDSLLLHYISLTRDFISIQNTAGYETLKSRGLEFIQDDLLRLPILSLYEYDYQILRKLEEEYAEMQFHTSYFETINRILAPNFIFDDDKRLVGMDFPITISVEDEKFLLLSLLKIRMNRQYIIGYYKKIEEEVLKVQQRIKKALKR